MLGIFCCSLLTFFKIYKKFFQNILYPEQAISGSKLFAKVAASKEGVNETNLNIGRVEISLFYESSTEVGGTERHPESLHVTWWISSLFTHVLINMGLQYMMA